MSTLPDFSGAKTPSVGSLQFSEPVADAMVLDPVFGRKLASVATRLHALRLGNMTKTAAPLRDSCKKVMAEDTTPAGVLLVAARSVFGPEMTTWEPDTLHNECRSEGINISPTNFDKILAAATLLDNPAFYFEVNTFSNTVHAFNDIMPDPEVLLEAHPAQISWAVVEAELILQENALWEPAFDYEPIIYTAAVLHRTGMVMAPLYLEFAQEQLDTLTKDAGLKFDAVKTAWEALPKTGLADKTFNDEDPMDAQLARLAACHVYVADRTDAYTLALQKLNS